MKAGPPRLIVGWRQVPVTKARVRPVQPVPAPRVAAAKPAAKVPDGRPEPDEESE